MRRFGYALVRALLEGAAGERSGCAPSRGQITRLDYTCYYTIDYRLD
jgi:hypothetical protein